MDSTQRKKLIHAARTGQLTEAEYVQYQELLQSNPSLLNEQMEDEWLQEAFITSTDDKLYEVVNQFTLPRHRYKERQAIWYKIAAGVAILLVAGGTYWWFQKTPENTITHQETLDFYNGDSTDKNQLGYAEGDLAIGTVALTWYLAPIQKEILSYRFCNDTLKLFMKDTANRASIKKSIRLDYRPSQQKYYLQWSKNTTPVWLEECRPASQPLNP